MKIFNIYKCLLFLLLLAGFVACTKKEHGSDQITTPELQLKLTYEKIEDGSRFAIIFFTVTEGWHIYGPYSQNNGRPTSILFENGSGTIAEMFWPQTKTFDEGDSGPSEGYDGLFQVRIKLQESEVSENKLKAKVSWVACKGICVPGEAELIKRID